MSETKKNLLVFGALLILLAATVVAIGIGSMDNRNDEQVATNNNNGISISGNLETNEKVVYQKIEPSLVTIYASSNTNMNMSSSSPVSQGSGFVYSGNYIVTNYHVIDLALRSENSEVFARFYDGEWKQASIKGHDESTDIAVLQFENEGEYPSLKLLDNELPRVGDRVLAAGSPRGFEDSITTGIISGTQRTMRSTKTQYSIPDTIQTDAALTQGNSGGPLVNMDGTVVGINRAVQDNIGLAVSSRLTHRIANSLIDTGDHQHPFIGVSTVEFNPASPTYDIDVVDQGIMVVETLEGSPASEVLQGGNNSNPGDIIRTIDGVEVNDNEDLSSYLLRKKAPEETIELGIIRNGEEKTVSFKLGERP